jgi:hypothetical protein
MTEDTPTDRAVMAIIQRLALAVERIQTTLDRIRQRLMNLGRSRR